MRLLYFLAIAAVIAAIWFRFRRRVKTDAAPTAKATKVEWDPDPGYNAVAVNPGPDACAAVRAIAEQHFSPQDAPRLPLDGCDQKDCACTYNRDTQRREASRRRADDGLKDFMPPETERRDKQRRDS